MSDRRTDTRNLIGSDRHTDTGPAQQDTAFTASIRDTCAQLLRNVRIQGRRFMIDPDILHLMPQLYDSFLHCFLQAVCRLITSDYQLHKCSFPPCELPASNIRLSQYILSFAPLPDRKKSRKRFTHGLPCQLQLRDCENRFYRMIFKVHQLILHS